MRLATECKYLAFMSKRIFSACCCFWRREKPIVPTMIKELFEKYSKNGIMSVDQLKMFLIEVQKEDKSTNKDAQKILDFYKRSRTGLSPEAFFHYIFNDALNSALSPSVVHHEMTAPLSHYFIYTSHNSYLTENGITGDCSYDPIVHALKNGVRVIELDIWPNAFGDDVEVRHGRTFTAAVELIKCLRSIREYAFVASPYPVIIALENHLDPDLQAKVVKMLIETFGEMLFSPDSLECLKELPSPESLKFKILVTTKQPKEYLDCEERDPWPESDEEDKSDNDEDSDDGLDDCLRVDPDKVKCLSINDVRLHKAVETHREKIVRFTQRNFLRVYPRVVDMNSSNYNPVIWWMHGIQMVAINILGCRRRALCLIQGMFKGNGGCGYVKKPDFLLAPEPPLGVLDPDARLLAVKTTLKVTVYIGNQIQSYLPSFWNGDLTLRVGIYGVPADCAMKHITMKRMETLSRLGKELTFPLRFPELALLHIEEEEAYTNDERELQARTCLPAQTWLPEPACLPVSELRQGIRTVYLWNEWGGHEFYPTNHCLRLSLVLKIAFSLPDP